MHDAKLAGISGGRIGEYIKNKMDVFETHSRSQNNGTAVMRRSVLQEG